MTARHDQLTMGLTAVLNRRVVVLTLFFFVLLSIARSDEDGSDDEPVGNYLYSEYEKDVVYPVVEYIAEDTGSGDSVNNTRERPDFLYSSKSGHRIVEFYAPWCPHCQAFVSSYVAFGIDLQEMASKLNEHVDIHAVSCVAHKELCQDYHVSQYPTFYIFKAGSINGTELDNFYELHVFHALQALFSEGDGDNLTNALAEESTAAKIIGKSNNLQAKRIQSESTPRTKQDIYNDAFLSFDFAIRNSIFMERGPLPDSQQQMFKDWIDLLHNTLPPTWRIHNMINAIRDNMDKVLESEQALLDTIKPHSPTKKKWSDSCNHGDNKQGYTCGLWELFHIMTIGLVEFNYIVSDKEMVVKTMHAGNVLRNYVADHFGCLVCQENFLDEYDNCALDRCNRLTDEAGEFANWQQLALWLWELHNGVNLRLLREREILRSVSYQDEIKVRYPQKRHCPRCWRDDDTWDEYAVFMFLRSEYWPEDTTTVEYRKLLSLGAESGDTITNGDEGGSSWILSSFAFISFFLIFALWLYVQNLTRVQSGRHKRK